MDDDEFGSCYTVAVEDLGQAGLWAALKEAFDARVPFKNVSLVNKLGKVTTVPTLPIQYVMANDKRLLKIKPMSDSLAVWWRLPYVYIILICTADINEYRANLKPNARKVVTELEKEATNRCGLTEWLVVYVRPPSLDPQDKAAKRVFDRIVDDFNTPTTTTTGGRRAQPTCPRVVRLDWPYGDGSTSTASLPFLSTAAPSAASAFFSDLARPFSAGSTAPPPPTPPPPPPVPSGFRPQGTGLSSAGPSAVQQAAGVSVSASSLVQAVSGLVGAGTGAGTGTEVSGMSEVETAMKECIRQTFKSRQTAYVEAVQRMLAQRFEPGWLFSQLFLCKDCYTQQLEGAGLWSDAMQESVELETVFGEALQRGGVANLDFGCHGDGDDCASLVYQSRRSIRRSMFKRGVVNELAFRQFLFATQARHLLKQGSPIHMAQRGLSVVLGIGNRMLEQQQLISSGQASHQPTPPPLFREVWTFTACISLALTLITSARGSSDVDSITTGQPVSSGSSHSRPAGSHASTPATTPDAQWAVQLLLGGDGSGAGHADDWQLGMNVGEVVLQLLGVGGPLDEEDPASNVALHRWLMTYQLNPELHSQHSALREYHQVLGYLYLIARAQLARLARAARGHYFIPDPSNPSSPEKGHPAGRSGGASAAEVAAAAAGRLSGAGGQQGAQASHGSLLSTDSNDQGELEYYSLLLAEFDTDREASARFEISSLEPQATQSQLLSAALRATGQAHHHSSTALQPAAPASDAPAPSLATTSIAQGTAAAPQPRHTKSGLAVPSPGAWVDIPLDHATSTLDTPAPGTSLLPPHLAHLEIGPGPWQDDPGPVVAGVLRSAEVRHSAAGDLGGISSGGTPARVMTTSMHEMSFFQKLEGLANKMVTAVTSFERPAGQQSQAGGKPGSQHLATMPSEAWDDGLGATAPTSPDQGVTRLNESKAAKLPSHLAWVSDWRLRIALSSPPACEALLVQLGMLAAGCFMSGSRPRAAGLVLSDTALLLLKNRRWDAALALLAARSHAVAKEGWHSLQGVLLSQAMHVQHMLGHPHLPYTCMEYLSLPQESVSREERLQVQVLLTSTACITPDDRVVSGARDRPEASSAFDAVVLPGLKAFQVHVPSSYTSSLIGTSQQALALLGLTQHDSATSDPSATDTTDFRSLLQPPPRRQAPPRPYHTTLSVHSSTALATGQSDDEGQPAAGPAASADAQGAAGDEVKSGGAQLMCVGQLAYVEVVVFSNLPGDMALQGATLKLGCLQPVPTPATPSPVCLSPNKAEPSVASPGGGAQLTATVGEKPVSKVVSRVQHHRSRSVSYIPASSTLNRIETGSAQVVSSVGPGAGAGWEVGTVTALDGSTDTESQQQSYSRPASAKRGAQAHGHAAGPASSAPPHRLSLAGPSAMRHSTSMSNVGVADAGGGAAQGGAATWDQAAAAGAGPEAGSVVGGSEDEGQLGGQEEAGGGEGWVPGPDMDCASLVQICPCDSSSPQLAQAGGGSGMGEPPGMPHPHPSQFVLKPGNNRLVFSVGPAAPGLYYLKQLSLHMGAAEVLCSIRPESGARAVPVPATASGTGSEAAAVSRLWYQVDPGVTGVTPSVMLVVQPAESAVQMCAVAPGRSLVAGAPNQWLGVCVAPLAVGSVSPDWTHVRLHVSTPDQQSIRLIDHQPLGTPVAAAGFGSGGGAEVLGPSLAVPATDHGPFGSVDDPLMMSLHAATDAGGRGGLGPAGGLLASASLQYDSTGLMAGLGDTGMTAGLHGSKGSAPMCKALATLLPASPPGASQQTLAADDDLNSSSRRLSRGKASSKSQPVQQQDTAGSEKRDYSVVSVVRGAVHVGRLLRGQPLSQPLLIWLPVHCPQTHITNPQVISILPPGLPAPPSKAVVGGAPAGVSGDECDECDELVDVSLEYCSRDGSWRSHEARLNVHVRHPFNITGQAYTCSPSSCEVLVVLHVSYSGEQPVMLQEMDLVLQAGFCQAEPLWEAALKLPLMLMPNTSISLCWRVAEQKVAGRRTARGALRDRFNDGDASADSPVSSAGPFDVAGLGERVLPASESHELFGGLSLTTDPGDDEDEDLLVGRQARPGLVLAGLGEAAGGEQCLLLLVYSTCTDAKHVGQVQPMPENPAWYRHVQQTVLVGSLGPQGQSCMHITFPDPPSAACVQRSGNHGQPDTTQQGSDQADGAASSAAAHHGLLTGSLKTHGHPPSFPANLFKWGFTLAHQSLHPTTGDELGQVSVQLLLPQGGCQLGRPTTFMWRITRIKAATTPHASSSPRGKAAMGGYSHSTGGLGASFLPAVPPTGEQFGVGAHAHASAANPTHVAVTDHLQYCVQVNQGGGGVLGPCWRLLSKGQGNVRLGAHQGAVATLEVLVMPLVLGHAVPPQVQISSSNTAVTLVQEGRQLLQTVPP